MSRDECIFRRIECRFPVSSEDNNDPCTLCLAGQQIDSIELLTSAIMEKRIDLLHAEIDAQAQYDADMAEQEAIAQAEAEAIAEDNARADQERAEDEAYAASQQYEDDMHEPN